MRRKISFEEIVKQKFNQNVEQILDHLAKEGYTKKQAAEYLECSQSTITTYSSKYKTPFISLSPQQRAVPQAANHHADLKIPPILYQKWL